MNNEIQVENVGDDESASNMRGEYVVKLEMIVVDDDRCWVLSSLLLLHSSVSFIELFSEIWFDLFEFFWWKLFQ